MSENVTSIFIKRDLEMSANYDKLQKALDVELDEVQSFRDWIKEIATKEEEVVFPDIQTAGLVAAELLKLPEYDAVIYFEPVYVLGRKGGFYRILPVYRVDVKVPLLVDNKLYASYLKQEVLEGRLVVGE